MGTRVGFAVRRWCECGLVVLAVMLSPFLVNAVPLTAAQAEEARRCRLFGTFEVGFLGNDSPAAGGGICDWLSKNAVAGEGAIALGSFLRVVAAALMVLVVMASLLALVWAGYIYMTSAGDAGRTKEAKTWVASALFGLALALLSYLLLSLVNQSTVNYY